MMLFDQALQAQRNGRLKDAERIYRQIIANDRRNFDALHMLGVICSEQGDFKDAEEFFRRALSIDARFPPCFHNFGLHFAKRRQFAAAVEQFDKALSLAPDYAPAHSDRGSALTELARLDEAHESHNKAVALAPNVSRAWFNRALLLSKKGALAAALEDYERALKCNINSADAWSGRGDVLRELKRYDDAFAAYDKALSLKPDLPEAWCGRGNVFVQIKRYEDAFAAYQKALAVKPDLLGAWVGCGNAHAALKQYDEALSAYHKALAVNPDSAESWLGCGNVYSALKDFDEAFRAYQKAIAARPDLAEAWLGRGNAYTELRRYDDALSAYDHALNLKPDLAEAWSGRGGVLTEFRRYDEALSAYDRAIGLEPDLPEAWNGRGEIFYRMSHYAKAVDCYERLFEISPDFKYLAGGLLHSKMMCCDWKNLSSIEEFIVRSHQNRKAVIGPFGYQAVAKSARELQVCAEIFVADRFPPSQRALWRADRHSNPKIRIGYLSGEFRDHLTSRQLVGLFECHDKNHFEVVAFDNGWNDGSDIRARILAPCDRVIDISRMDDQKASDVISESQIDILVNLNGYFGGGRTTVFSHKPAPIQVSYFGYSATMGADYIDYILVDRYVVPSAAKKFYTEKVVSLPDCYQVNDDKREAVGAAARAEFELPDSGFVFCCFNNSFKITPELFDVWMRLLDQVKDSILWLGGSPDVARNLRMEAMQRGIAPERVVIASRTNHSDYLRRCQVADLFLDTYPFNAGVTAADMLWSGLPLLTCSGEPYTARMAGSLLNAVGLPELVTHSFQEYEAMALELARNSALLASLRAKLAQNRGTFPLFDTKRISRHIENAYVLMDERFRAGLPPDDIEVPETASLLPSGRWST